MDGDLPHVTELFQKTARPTVREPETDDALPAQDSPYMAFSRRSNKPELSLHFITPAGTIRSFQYAHLDSNSSFTAECITLRFMGMEPVKVLVHGRPLRRLYDYIHQHRITWIREAAQEFSLDDEAIVTKVRFDAVKDGDAG